MDGALYHVSARANRKEMILDSAEIRDLFLKVVARARKRYRFRIENFCVMGNHYHLMIRPGPHESLSRIMQWIMSVFAMEYNREFKLTGHVWGERFFSRIIKSFWEYLITFDYIDTNPVEACLVPFARDWRHGGLWHNRNGCRQILKNPPDYVILAFPSHSGLSRSSCLLPMPRARLAL
jgi:putative transposase